MWPPSPFSALPPLVSSSRLALKLFRGEPAISKFDWNFSPIHSSSPSISTDVWFGPPRDFTPASPCPWIGHLVSGLRLATLRPIQTRFRFGFRPAVLNLATKRNSPVRSTKSTRSCLNCTPSACKRRVSGSLSLPSRGSFHLSLTVLCAIGHQLVFSLGGWSPLLPTGFLVSCGTLGLGSVPSAFDYRALTVSGWPFLTYSSSFQSLRRRPATPHP